MADKLPRYAGIRAEPVAAVEGVLPVYATAPPRTAPSVSPGPSGKYCVVIIPDGEYPTVTTYDEAADALRRLRNARTEFLDVVGLVFHGTFLPFTDGDRICLCLPDGEHAIAAGLDGGTVTLKLEDIKSLPRSETGQLGPKYLTHSEGALPFPDDEAARRIVRRRDGPSTAMPHVPEIDEPGMEGDIEEDEFEPP